MSKKCALLLAAAGAAAAGLAFLGYVKREVLKGYASSVSERLRRSPQPEVEA